MNKFLNKLTSTITSLMIFFVPVKTEAGVMLNFIKLIVNSVGLGLSIYGYKKISFQYEPDTVKYALAATGLFSANIIADLYDIASDLSSSKEKDKLEKKVERLEIENSILRSSQK